MKQNLLITIALALAVFTGCKKESKSNKNSNIVSTADGYMPFSAGSSWEYAVNTSGITDTLTITMTGATNVFNNVTYYLATSFYKAENVTNQGSFFDSNHVYGALAAATGQSAVTLDMLNDTASVGYTWTSLPSANGLINNVPAKLINKITEKNVTRTVNGKPFSNVSHTQALLQYNSGSGYATAATYDFYLAKGVGMIEMDENELGVFSETETLFSYTIK